MYPLHPTINIDDAIKRANLRIKAPGLTLMLTCIVAGTFFAVVGDDTMLYNAIAVFFIAGAFVFSILFSLIATTKWRIWAFSHVDNVHELLGLAEQEKILPRAGSWQWKLSIETKADKEKLKELEQRFNEPIKPLQDASVPESTEIYAYNIIRTLLTFLMMGILLYLIVLFDGFPQQPWLADPYIKNVFVLIPLGLASFTVYKWNNIRQEQPTVTLSDAGIETPGAGYKPWDSIQNERVEVEYTTSHSNTGSATTKTTYLMFEHTGGTAKINVNIASERRRRIYYLLKIYRTRHEMRNKRF